MNDVQKGKAHHMFQVLSAAGLLEHFEWNNERIIKEERRRILNVLAQLAVERKIDGKRRMVLEIEINELSDTIYDE